MESYSKYNKSKEKKQRKNMQTKFYSQLQLYMSAAISVASRLWNDLKCVEWDVKPYYTSVASTPSSTQTFHITVAKVRRQILVISLQNVNCTY